jgi:hypothetical protein
LVRSSRMARGSSCPHIKTGSNCLGLPVAFITYLQVRYRV